MLRCRLNKPVSDTDEAAPTKFTCNIKTSFERRQKTEVIDLSADYDTISPIIGIAMYKKSYAIMRPRSDSRRDNNSR